MPASKGQKDRSRARILDVAARLFSRRGFDGVGIDAIMAEAGLTRGGFYAHFPSKAALFAEVIATRHDLVQALRARTASAPDPLQDQAAAILQARLATPIPGAGHTACSFASLAADAARGPEPVRQAFAAQIDAFWEELFRGRASPPTPDDTDTALRILSLSVGALALARAADDGRLSDALLAAARSQVASWMRDLQAGKEGGSPKIPGS